MRDNYADFSNLEREFELEMEGPTQDNLEMDFESASEDLEFGSEQDFEFEQDEELPDDTEVSFEKEDSDFEFEGDYVNSRSQEFVERFLELGGRQFETSYEVDAAMSEVLDDIEREYFFGAIKRGLKKLSKNKLLKSLAKKGLSMGVNKFFPGLKGALQLARGNVKGALLNFGKQALGSVVPGGGAMLDTVTSLGLQSESGDPQDRETWENYVNFSREAYEHLAENLTPKADQPAEAMRLANNAVQHAIAKAQARSSGVQRPRVHRRTNSRIVRLRVSPGERIKLMIVGA
jgi:hypothetical protein